LAALEALDSGSAASGNDAFMQRLSRWFDWTDAIALSAALAAPPASPDRAAASGAPGGPAAGGVRASGHPPMLPQQREVARVRASLQRTLAQWPSDVDSAAGFGPWREEVHARQQAMEAAVATLRRRLRDALTAGSPAQARVAALDAVLEQVLVPRERELLATVPRWLERRFERARRAPSVAPAAFRRELVELLQAELEFRMQPVEGLLAALEPTFRESS
jgi:hypothetical protein